MNNRHYTVIVAAGHSGFIRVLTTCAVQTSSRSISVRAYRTALHHPDVSILNVEFVQIDDERIGELTKVQSDWREDLRDLAQSRVSNFNEALNEVRSPLQRDDESRSQGEDGQGARPAECLQSQLSDGWAQMGKLQNNMRGQQ